MHVAEGKVVTTGIFPTICAEDVAATRDFYAWLFDFRVVFDAGWYVQLEAPGETKPQIGLVQRDHHTVPEAFRRAPAGVLISIEVDDVDAVHARAVAAGAEPPLALRDEDFGQRHFTPMFHIAASSLVRTLLSSCKRIRVCAGHRCCSGGP